MGMPTEYQVTQCGHTIDNNAKAVAVLDKGVGCFLVYDGQVSCLACFWCTILVMMFGSLPFLALL